MSHESQGLQTKALRFQMTHDPWRPVHRSLPHQNGGERTGLQETPCTRLNSLCPVPNPTAHEFPACGINRTLQISLYLFLPTFTPSCPMDKPLMVEGVNYEILWADLHSTHNMSEGSISSWFLASVPMLVKVRKSLRDRNAYRLIMSTKSDSSLSVCITNDPQRLEVHDAVAHHRWLMVHSISFPPWTMSLRLKT